MAAAIIILWSVPKGEFIFLWFMPNGGDFDTSWCPPPSVGDHYYK